MAQAPDSGAGGALGGVVALELAGGVAGAYAGRLLSDLGARVVLAEPASGSRLRRLGPFPGAEPHPDPALIDAELLERGGLHLALNAGKESSALDLGSGAGRSRLAALARGADLLIGSQSPADLERLGVGLERLEAENPALVYAAATAYGWEGPHAGRRSSEIADYATGGSMYFCGDPEREPLMVHSYQAELHAGLHLALGALAALREAAASGRGQRVEVSAQEAMISDQVWLGSSWQWGGAVWRRRGTGLIPCRDGAVIWGRAGPEVFLMMGRPELMEDPRAQSQESWLAWLPEVRRMLIEWAADHPMQELYHLGQALGLKMTPVNTVSDLDESAQLRARGWWRSLDHPRAGAIEVPGPPWRLSRSPSGPGRPAPLLGEHTGLVLEPRDAPPPRAAPGEPALPLAGLRVLEVTSAWAGPLAGRHLADLGADVVVVERAIVQSTRSQHFPGGDQSWPGFYNRGSSYNMLNRNKRAIVLDLKAPDGRDALLRLAERADVVLENNSPRVMPSLGIGYEQLAQRNPGVVLCSVSAFGASGPEASYTALGSNIEGSSGLVAQTGYGPGERYATGSFHADPIGGTLGALVTLAALAERERSGRGQHVDVSLLESGGSFLVDSLLEYRLSGRVAEPRGNRSRRIAPQGAYRSAGDDCWLAVGVEDDEQWLALAGVIGRPELAARWPDLASRRGAHDEIDRAITEWSEQVDHRRAAELLQQAGVAAAPVLANWEIVSDPHLYERGYWVELVHPETGLERWEGLPWRLSRLPARDHAPAPLLGQHSDEVLAEGGLAPAEIASLREQGVVKDTPADLALFIPSLSGPTAPS
ncbi:MAG: CoA transferase [Chloroflexi bacterium]|nr:CoA transferase [Chloroflexota bacterium]